MLKTILIIVISVTLFGVIFFLYVKKSVTEEILQQAYFPKKNISELEAAP